MSEEQPQVVEAKYMPQKKKKARAVNVKLTGRTAKYVVARAKGLNKKEAAIEAGYKSVNNQTKIEKTKTYDAIVTHYKDVLLGNITLNEIAQEHVKNIVQDEDRGAKNTAIKMAMERIEPDAAPPDDDDKVTVVLKM